MMLRLSKTLFLTIALTLAGVSQAPDFYDTLHTRCSKELYIPRWDTIRQLEEINQKADTIIRDLSLIKRKLGIEEPARKDTIQ